MPLQAIIAGVGIATSLYSASKAKTASSRSNEAQKRITLIKNQQFKRAFLNSARSEIANAVTRNLAGGGGFESSRGQAAVSSIKSQADTSIREFAAQETLGAEITKQANIANSANFTSSLANAATTFATSASGTKFLNDLGTRLGIP